MPLVRGWRKPTAGWCTDWYLCLWLERRYDVPCMSAQARCCKMGPILVGVLETAAEPAHWSSAERVSGADEG